MNYNTDYYFDIMKRGGIIEKMSLLDKRERSRIMQQVELNAKQKGKYLNVDLPNFKEFVNDVVSKYPSSKKIVTNVLENPKNIIKEYVKHAHVGAEIENVVDKEWFKSILTLILKSAKAALNLAYNIIKSIRRYIGNKLATSNMVDKLAVGGVVTGISLSLAGLTGGLTACVILIALSMWLNRANEKLTSINVKDKESWLGKIKSYAKEIYNNLLGKEPEPLPEELAPPVPEVPNISFTIVKEDTVNEQASLNIIMGGLFVLFLKAVIAYRLSEELNEKLMYLKALFKPVGIILSISSILALLGSGATSALVS